jgi:molybdopterin-guanine dinucleotide biosynthesis protein A
MSELEGFVLAGGASSRMGRDKARLRLGGRTLAERAASAVAAVAGRVSLVSPKEGAKDFGLPVVRDLYAGRGPVGGLHAALAHCRAPWALVVSCDLPFVTARLLALLASRRRAESDAVAPVQPDGRWQPLCALYAARPCAAAAEKMIVSGELSSRALLGRVRTRLVGPAEYASLAGAEDFFLNVNTPEEFALALSRADER